MKAAARGITAGCMILRVIVILGMARRGSATGEGSNWVSADTAVPDLNRRHCGILKEEL